MFVSLIVDETYTNKTIGEYMTDNMITDNLNVAGYNWVGFNISGVLGGAKVTFYASIDTGELTEWFSIAATNVSTGLSSIDATENGIYRIQCSGIKFVRAVLQLAGLKETYVSDTDYTLNIATGEIHMISSMPNASRKLKANYTYTVSVEDEILEQNNGSNYLWINHKDLTPNSEIIKIDGVTQILTTDYTLNDIINSTATRIDFVVTPPDNSVITASYEYVLSVTGEILAETAIYGDLITAQSPILTCEVYVDQTAISIKTVVTI